MWNIFGEGPISSNPQSWQIGQDDQGPLSWQEQALCAQTDPEAFFPEKGGSTREAKAVCELCEVRDECLSYALEMMNASESGAVFQNGNGADCGAM